MSPLQVIGQSCESALSLVHEGAGLGHKYLTTKEFCAIKIHGLDNLHKVCSRAFKTSKNDKFQNHEAQSFHFLANHPDKKRGIFDPENFEEAITNFLKEDGETVVELHTRVSWWTAAAA